MLTGRQEQVIEQVEASVDQIKEMIPRVGEFQGIALSAFIDRANAQLDLAKSFLQILKVLPEK